MLPLCCHHNFYGRTKGKQKDIFTIYHATDAKIHGLTQSSNRFCHFLVADIGLLYGRRVQATKSSMGSSMELPCRIGPLKPQECLLCFPCLHRHTPENLQGHASVSKERWVFVLAETCLEESQLSPITHTCPKESPGMPLQAADM